MRAGVISLTWPLYLASKSKKSLLVTTSVTEALDDDLVVAGKGAPDGLVDLCGFFHLRCAEAAAAGVGLDEDGQAECLNDVVCTNSISAAQADGVGDAYALAP